MYPQAVVPPGPGAVAAASKRAIFEGISQHWYASNSQPGSRSQISGFQPSFSLDQRPLRKASATPLVVGILRSQDQQFNLGMNSLRQKYASTPGLALADIGSAADIAARPSERHVLIASSAEAERAANELSRLPNRDSVFAILCRAGDVPQTLRQSFNMTTSNLQAIDSHIQGVLRQMQQGSSRLPAQPYQPATGVPGWGDPRDVQRSVSAPQKCNPNELRRSQIRYINKDGEVT